MRNGRQFVSKFLGIAAASLLAFGSANAGPIDVDPTATGSSVDATITSSRCIACFVDATLAADLEAAYAVLDVGDSFTFDFFDLVVGGLFGGAQISVDAVLALASPAGAAEGTGFGGFASFFFFFNGVQLTWDQPDAIALDDGTFLGVSFEDLYELGIGNTFTVTATITRYDAAPVPEPGTAALLMVGLFALWFASRQGTGRRRVSADTA